MRKICLQKEQRMSPAVFVAHAAERLETIVRREASGPGDYLEALRRLANRHGVPFGTYWGLRYRQPKSIDVSVYARICAEAQRVERRDGAECQPAAIAAAQGFISQALSRGAAALHGVAAADAGAALSDARSALSDESGARAMDRLAARMDGDEDWPMIPG
jgi:hypothetical protein